MHEEKWLAIPTWEGLYEASSLGRIRSLTRMRPMPNGGMRAHVGKVLAPSVGASGYLQVVLNDCARKVTIPVHRAVCRAFHGPKQKGLQCRHLDGNQRNNAASNLEWGTPLQNAGDRLRHGTYPLGAKNHKSKLTEAQAREILATVEPHVVTAKKFCVTPELVGQIRNRVAWKHLNVPTK